MDKMFNCLQHSVLNSTGITLKRDLKQYVDEGHWRRDLWLHHPYGCYVRVSRIKRLGRKMWSLDNKNIDKCGLLIRRPVRGRAGWRGAACHANRWTRSQSSSLCGWRRSWVKTLLSEKGTAISSPQPWIPMGWKVLFLEKSQAYLKEVEGRSMLHTKLKMFGDSLCVLQSCRNLGRLGKSLRTYENMCMGRKKKNGQQKERTCE